MKQIILIDLDVLLDTRIGTLTQYDEDIALEVIGNGFQHRVSDELEPYTKKLSTTEFKNLYQSRNEDTLKVSRLTNFIFELVDLVKQIEDGYIKDDSRINDGEVVINIYPYKLEEDVLTDIVKAVEIYTGEIIPVKVGYYRPSVLDIPSLKEMGITTYITYDYESWFLSNFSIEKGKDAIVPYPKLSIVAPALLSKSTAFDGFSSEDKSKLGNQNPFDFFSTYWAPLFGIKFCPIELMSLLDTSILPN